MYAIRVTANDKKNLPLMMLVALRRRYKFGLLDGFIHAKDDTVQEISYGWEMISHWDTPKKDKDPFAILNNTIVYEECLKESTDMLYRLLDVCRSCWILPEINSILSEIAEHLKELE